MRFNSKFLVVLLGILFLLSFYSCNSEQEEVTAEVEYYSVKPTPQKEISITMPVFERYVCTMEELEGSLVVAAEVIKVSDMCYTIISTKYGEHVLPCECAIVN